MKRERERERERESERERERERELPHQIYTIDTRKFKDKYSLLYRAIGFMTLLCNYLCVMGYFL